MDDEYQILSHDEIERLKKEAEKYKNNPFVKHGEDEKLYNSIENLTKSMNRLATVFEDVKQHILKEQEEGEGPDKKLTQIMEQNKNIARALVSFGEKIEEIKEEPKEETQTQEIKQEEQTQETKNPPELDYQSWNYSQPQKPGVSQTKKEMPFNQFAQNQNMQQQEPEPNQFAQNQNMQQQNNQNPQQFQTENTMNQENQQKELFQQNQQNPQFTQNTNPNQFQPNFNQNTTDNEPNEKPELKPISKTPPKKKKRTFGLF